MRSILVILLLAIPLAATGPQLTNPTQLCSPCARAFPCATAACNAANVNAEILYDAPTSSGGCAEIWSMHTDGTNKVDISQTAGFTSALYGPTRSYGAASYSPDGHWIVFTAMANGTTAACTGKLNDPGSGINTEVWVCGTNPIANCTKLRSVVANIGQGYLWPLFTLDGTKIFVGRFHSAIGGPIGGYMFLDYGTFTAGTPPTLTSGVEIDPYGDGTGTQNYYEPASSDLENGTTTCILQFMTSNTVTSPTLLNASIAKYNLCTMTNLGYVSNTYNPTSGSYNEFATQSNAHMDAQISISSALLPRPTDLSGGLDLVLYQGNSGDGAVPLTGYNIPGFVEYNPTPTIVKSPRWSADGTFITATVVPGALQPGQPGYTPSIYKWTYNLVPFQSSGKTVFSGKTVSQ